jgi:hypothetical protein
MDFWRTVAVLFRRFYITVPAFAATLGLAAAAYSVVPVEYESNSVLVLTTPLSGGTESTQPNHPNPVTNPLMNFEASLALTASIVIQQLTSPDVANSLGIVSGGTTGYTVNNGTTNPELLQSGPFLFVQGTGPSAEAAQDITKKVSVMAAEVLDQRQDEVNAPASTHIEVQVVVAPTAGQALDGSPLRAAAAAAALAGLLSLVAVYGFESLMTHRRRRRQEKQAARDQAGRSSALDEDVAPMGSRTRPATDLDRFTSPHLVREGSEDGRNRSSRRTATGGAVGLLEGRPKEEA